jgi:hypothetical protein
MNGIPAAQTSHFLTFLVVMGHERSLSHETKKFQRTGRKNNKYCYQHSWKRVAISDSEHVSVIKNMC